MAAHRMRAADIGRDDTLSAYLEQERRSHEAFAASRRGIYVEHADAMDALDAFVEGAGTSGLIISGESGAGKSALVANWAERRRRSARTAFIVEHYIGASSASANHVELIRRVMAEIRARYSIDEALPLTAGLLEENFPLWLAKVQSESLVLVIDGLNQLDRPDEVGRWLPEYIQPHVRIVATCTGGTILDALEDRGWRVWRVDPLSTGERTEIVRRYVHQNRITLDPEYLERVTSAGPTANPLFLRTSLDELRLAAGGVASTGSIDRYLAAANVPELMTQVLERIEREVGADVAGSALSLLWASRSGLTAGEVASIVGQVDGVVEGFLASLSLHLINRDGRLGFFHEQLRDAVRQRWLEDPGAELAVRRRIVEHFASAPASRRTAEELPWQLWRLADWAGLAACVSVPEMIEALQRSGDHIQLLVYWSELRTHVDAATALLERTTKEAAAIDDPGRVADLYELVGGFLGDAGEITPAVFVMRQARSIRRESFREDHPQSLRCAVSLAKLLEQEGEHVEGERLLRAAIATLESAGDKQSRYYLEALETLGTLLFKRSELDSALPVCTRALEIAESSTVGDVQVERFLSLMGAVYFGRLEYPLAKDYLARATALAGRRLGRNHPVTVECVNNLGTVFEELGEHDRAELSFRDAIAAWERLFGPRSVPVAQALGNLSIVLLRTGRGTEAVEAQRRSVEILRVVLGESHPATATMLCNLASAFREVGSLGEAEIAQRSAIAAFVSSYGEDHNETTQSYLDLALILALGGDALSAIELYRRYLPRKAQWLGVDHPSTRRSISKYREILATAGIEESADPLGTLWSTAQP